MNGTKLGASSRSTARWMIQKAALGGCLFTNHENLHEGSHNGLMAQHGKKALTTRNQPIKMSGVFWEHNEPTNELIERRKK